ncbi:MAG: thioredoxin domain-containing protein [Oscillospiraceae bacterium]|nr:thioredoxin domain-containing protein [Oscillospiraceae bacterium]
MENRLKQSASPYLRSHADNPIPWHEWGPAAFAEARERDVPVFLSVGYSSCHWCHARLWNMGIHSEINALIICT